MKKKFVILHVVLWVFMILFVFDYHWFDIAWYEALYLASIEVVTYAVVFYSNLYMLQLLQQRGQFIGFIGSCLLVSMYVILMRYSGVERYFYGSTSGRNVLSMVLNTSLFIGLSYITYNLVVYYRKEEEYLKLDLKNKELQFNILKSKINPHFIFNTLNNMNALIESGDSRGSDLANKLSDLLRYAVDEGDKRFISLDKEWKQIQSYAELILLQEPESEQIDIYSEGINSSQFIIPFVLISFLENAIKHGNLKHNPDGFIHVELVLDDELIFTLRNSTDLKQIDYSGTGLRNIQQQLLLAYGEEHKLEQELVDGIHSVILTIPLTKINII